MSHTKIKRRHNHQAPVEVYHRTLEHFGMEGVLHKSDVTTMCRECYRKLHDHGDCSGPEHGGGCFPEEMITVGQILQYERDVCSDIPFEEEWNGRQQERFRRIHSRPLQEAWLARMKLVN